MDREHAVLSECVGQGLVARALAPFRGMMITNVGRKALSPWSDPSTLAQDSNAGGRRPAC